MSRRRLAAAAAALTALLGTTTALGATGDVSFRGCVSGNTATGPSGSDACALLPGAQTSGTSSGLNGPSAVAVSPDGKSLYAVSEFDDAILRFNRDADSGALTFKNCISGNTATGPSGTDACLLLEQRAAVNGAGSGMDGLRSVVVSSDGRSVYTAAENDDAVSHFRRGARGGLTFVDCATGRLLASEACGTVLPEATTIGTNGGMDSPQALALSRDGRSLYAATQLDDGVVRFRRNATTGVLTFKSCITGQTETGAGGTGACEDAPDAAAGGADSGLHVTSDLVVSRDGSSVYSIGTADSALTRFARDTQSGALDFRTCLTTETTSGPDGSGACSLAGEASSATGADTGMDEPVAGAISPDDGSVYVASQTDAAVTGFARGGSGAVAYDGCLTGEQASATPTGSCEAIPDAAATAGGNDSGLAAPAALAFAGPEHLYAALQSDHGLAHLRRNSNSGALSFRECITGEEASGSSGTGACEEIDSVALAGAGSGLDSSASIAVSRDREAAYLGAIDDDAVARFRLAR